MYLFLAEELLSKEGVKDLIGRDADAPIFGRLKLTYGKALQFKAAFGQMFPIEARRSLKHLAPTKHKPRLEEMAIFTPQQRTDYTVK